MKGTSFQAISAAITIMAALGCSRSGPPLRQTLASKTPVENITRPVHAEAAVPSPMGWATHSLSNSQDPYWTSGLWIDRATESGAGWIRDGLWFKLARTNTATPELPGLPENPLIVGVSPPTRINLAWVESYVDRTIVWMKSGFNVVWNPMGSERAGEGLNVPMMLAFLDRLKEKYPEGLDHLVIEVHNEPNLPAFWDGGDPVSYFEVVRELYLGLKPRYPRVPIIGGATAHFGLDYRCGYDWGSSGPFGVANPPPVCASYRDPKDWGLGYLKALLDLGIIDYVDGFSAHPYRASNAPEAGFSLIDPSSDPEGFIHEIRAWVAFIQSYNHSGKPLDFHFTELGHASSPTGLGSAGGQQRQADYNSRALAMLFHESLRARKREQSGQADGYNLRSFHINTLKDECPPKDIDPTPCGPDVNYVEKTTGSLTWDLVPKKAFVYYTRLAHQLDASALDAVEPDGVTITAPMPVATRLFRLRDGSGYLLAAWTRTPDPDPREVRIDLALAPGYRSVVRTDLEISDPTEVALLAPGAVTSSGMATASFKTVLSNHVILFKILTK